MLIIIVDRFQNYCLFKNFISHTFIYFVSAKSYLRFAIFVFCFICCRSII